jgi:argininosuccinate lyase
MPQKKNPYALAVIRTQAGQAAGDLAAALTTLHTGSARTDHFHLLNGVVPRAVEEAVNVTRLAAAVVDEMTVDVERMGQVARDGFTAAADVADVLALDGGLDYRTAHKVVGRAVRDLVEAGQPPTAMTGELLRRAAAEVAGHALELDETVLVGALDPAVDAAARRQTGSSSPEAMRDMLDQIDVELDEAHAACARELDRLRAAEEALLARSRELARSS